jgi:hypothetical protein
MIVHIQVFTGLFFRRLFVRQLAAAPIAGAAAKQKAAPWETG